MTKISLLAFGFLIATIHTAEAFTTQSLLSNKKNYYGGLTNKLEMATEAATAETYTVTPIKSLDGTVTLPGSKSLSNFQVLFNILQLHKSMIGKKERTVTTSSKKK